MTNKGIVREINDNNIKIEVFKDANCSHCDSCSSKTSGCKTLFYNKKDLKEGDLVDLTIEDVNLLKLGFLVYIVPILFMIISYFIASYFDLSESYRVLSSFLGLFLSAFIIYLVDKIKKNSILNNIKITKEKA